MRRAVKVLTVMLLVLAMVGSAFAAEATFVSSIEIKDHPDIVPTPDEYPAILVDDEGEFIDYVPDECLDITVISKIKDEEILKLYKDLVDGTTKLPYDSDSEDMVIRDLFYVDVTCPGRKEELKKDDVYLEITFDLNVDPDTKVVVMVNVEGEWVPVEVINNGDGTVTLRLPDVGLVAICVPAAKEPAKTGDNSDSKLMVWGAVCVLSMAGVVALVVIDMKKRHTN